TVRLKCSDSTAERISRRDWNLRLVATASHAHRTHAQQRPHDKGGRLGDGGHAKTNPVEVPILLCTEGNTYIHIVLHACESVLIGAAGGCNPKSVIPECIVDNQMGSSSRRFIVNAVFEEMSDWPV